MRHIAALPRASGIALLLALAFTADVGAQESAAATTPAHLEHAIAGSPLVAPQPSDPYLYCQAWKERAKKLKIEIDRTESALKVATGSKRKALQRKLKKLRKALRQAQLEMARWCR